MLTGKSCFLPSSLNFFVTYTLLHIVSLKAHSGTARPQRRPEMGHEGIGAVYRPTRD